MIKRLALAAALVAALAGRAFGQSPSDAQAAQAQAAVEALQNGDGDKAAALFEQLLRDFPNNAGLYLGAGLAAHLRGRNDEARHLLERALEIEPRLTAASAALGQVVYEQGDLAGAIKIYEDALKRAPTNRTLTAKLKVWHEEASKETRVDGPFSIAFEGPEEAQLAAHATEVLDRAYWRLGKALGAYPSEPIAVVFYSLKQFRAATGAPEWSAGEFDTRIRIPVKGALASRAAFDHVLTHELAHAMIAGIAPRGVPAWLHEGLATLLEPHDPLEAERRLRAAGAFVPLADLEDGFGTLTSAQAQIAYDESLVAANLVLQHFGRNTAVLLGQLARGKDISTEFDELGSSYKEFERELASRVR